jgi:hypothetical protein
MQTLPLFSAILARLWAPAGRAAVTRTPCYELFLQPDSPEPAPCQRCDGEPQWVALGRDAAAAASLRVVRPLRITCTRGTVWLTCERDFNDYVLQAGMVHLAEPGQSLVLLGMPSAAVVLAAL